MSVVRLDPPRVDVDLDGVAGWPGRLLVSTLGASHELASERPPHPTLSGRPVKRRVLEPGDVLRHGAFDLAFATGPAGPAPAERPEDATPASERQRELDALLLLARRCHAPLDPEALLEEILACVLELGGARRGCVLLAPGEMAALGWVPPGGEALPVAVSRRMDAADPDPVSRSVLERMVSSGRALLVADVRVDPVLRTSASLSAQGVRSVVAVPMVRDGRRVGAIYVDSDGGHRVLGPPDLERLEGVAAHVVAALAHAATRRRLSREADAARAVARAESARTHDPSRLVAESPAMRASLELIDRVAPQDTSVLILGESGTGKELLARALHDRSPRCDAPFVAVNCMALSPDLMESELFGHEKGAYTGATGPRAGRFELAHGGTLFLDEIGELEPRVQVKLLRVLQERTIERVGSARPRPVDVRLVCATHVDLARAVAEGRLRQDLYYRIAVFPISVPPLRDRPGDVPALVVQFLRELSGRMGRVIGDVEPAAAAALARYPWPGNVRELRNVIERAFVLARGAVLTLPALPEDVVRGVAPIPVPAPARSPGPGPGPAPPTAPGRSTFAEARSAFERRLVLERLEANGGNVARTARELDLPRSSLYRKLEEWGMVDRADRRRG
jgi:transcriptional regulator with GAF, ATPase, and Fis domain